MPAPKGTRPPAAGKGRKPGQLNSITVAAKEAYALAFDQLGGVPALVTWAKTNPDEFYRLHARLIPIDAKVSGSIQINWPLAPHRLEKSADV